MSAVSGATPGDMPTASSKHSHGFRTRQGAALKILQESGPAKHKGKHDAHKHVQASRTAPADSIALSSAAQAYLTQPSGAPVEADAKTASH
jgi:hypothetical protein